MTWNRNKDIDRSATKRLIFDLSSRDEFADVEPNWLGHTKGSASIDWDLLDGAPMSQLLNHRKTAAAVKKHLDHLEDDHGLEIDRSGIYRFTRISTEVFHESTIEIPDNDSNTTNPASGTESPIPLSTELDTSPPDQVSTGDSSLIAHAWESNEDVQIGAGFGDPLENKIVELTAVRIVVASYVEDGWSVRSVERDKCGFDLECAKGNVVEQVEVKGVSGDGLHFMITAGEVKQAQKNQNFFIVIVTSVLSASPTLTKFTGAEFLVRFELTAIQYRAALKP